MITIEGSQGEGGGQIVRTSLALSIFTGQAVHIRHIRANRSKPGLGAQHLAGLLAAGKICAAKITGAFIGSTEIIFEPGGPARAGEYMFDISKLAGRGSAGSATLLLQTILLPLALADGDSNLFVRGGTHVAWSPPAHYVQHVFVPALLRMGVQASLDHIAWGWYPQGGGEIRAQIKGGAHLTAVDFSDRGRLLRVSGVAVASNLPANIPRRISDRANNRLKEAGLRAGVQPVRATGLSAGAGISIALVYERAFAGFSALGAIGKPSNEVADEAIDQLLAFHNQDAALDQHLADQLLLPMALAEGTSSLSTERITRHSLTNIAVIREFIQRGMTLEGGLNQTGVIRVES